MADQNVNQKNSDEQPKADTNGVVQAPIETDVDNLPQGAVFTEVAADRTPASVPVVSRAPIPTPQPRPEQKVVSRTVETAPQSATITTATKKPSPKPNDPKPVAAIITAVVLFLALAAAAYLAYSHSK